MAQDDSLSTADTGDQRGVPESHDHSVADRQSGAHRRGKKTRSFWKELPILVVSALVLTFLIQTFLARVYLIPSESMEQTLNGCAGCTNDRILVDKVSYDFSDPKPGDVVVFRRPESWGQAEFTSNRSSNIVVRWFQEVASAVGLGAPNEEDLVKRIIATGGQTVQCCDNNRVVVDGKPLGEPYVYWQPDRGSTQMDFAPVRVPAGYLWVMGDNRNNSADSRIQGGGGEHGVVPVANVIGKARVIVLPPTRWRGIGDHNPQVAALGAPAWQVAVPAGVGVAAAWPALWLGRRLRDRLVPWRRTTR